MKYLVTMSPLAKVFQPRLQKELMEKPDRIWKKEEFNVIVRRMCGLDEIFISGKPKAVEDPNLIHWLSGGTEGNLCQETDNSGIVILNVSFDAIGALHDMIAMTTLPKTEQEKEVRKVNKDIRGQIKDAYEAARKLSEERVMREIRRVHECLKRQYEINSEAGMGKYQPSLSEFLCAYVLKKEEAETIERQKEITSQFSKLMGM